MNINEKLFHSKCTPACSTCSQQWCNLHKIYNPIVDRKCMPMGLSLIIVDLVRFSLSLIIVQWIRSDGHFIFLLLMICSNSVLSSIQEIRYKNLICYYVQLHISQNIHTISNKFPYFNFWQLFEFDCILPFFIWSLWFVEVIKASVANWTLHWHSWININLRWQLSSWSKSDSFKTWHKISARHRSHFQVN